jgi:hypothetical protein
VHGRAQAVGVEGGLLAVEDSPSEGLPGKHERDVEQGLLSVAQPLQRQRYPVVRGREGHGEQAQYSLQLAPPEGDRRILEVRAAVQPVPLVGQLNADARYCGVRNERCGDLSREAAQRLVFRRPVSGPQGASDKRGRRVRDVIGRVPTSGKVVHLDVPTVIPRHVGTASRLTRLQHVLNLLVDDTVRGQRRCQSHTGPRNPVGGVDRHMREVRWNRRMLPVGSRFRELDIHLQPQGRLPGLRLFRRLVDAHVEVLKADLALSFRGAEQPRQRLQDSGLARAVRTENIRQIIEIDRRRL